MLLYPVMCHRGHAEFPLSALRQDLQISTDHRGFYLPIVLLKGSDPLPSWVSGAARYRSLVEGGLRARMSWVVQPWSCGAQILRLIIIITGRLKHCRLDSSSHEDFMLSSVKYSHFTGELKTASKLVKKTRRRFLWRMHESSGFVGRISQQFHNHRAHSQH